ncbi:MAG: hypothetical protein ACREX4_05795 [Gammaproteobacteria bacterium]
MVPIPPAPDHNKGAKTMTNDERKAERTGADKPMAARRPLRI